MQLLLLLLSKVTLTVNCPPTLPAQAIAVASSSDAPMTRFLGMCGNDPATVWQVSPRKSIGDGQRAGRCTGTRSATWLSGSHRAGHNVSEHIGTSSYSRGSGGARS